MRRLVFFSALALSASLCFASLAAAQDQDEAQPPEEQVEGQLEEEIGTPVDLELSEQAQQQIEQLEEQFGPVEVEVPEQIAEPLQDIGAPVEVTVPKLQEGTVTFEEPQQPATTAQQGQQPETKGQPKAGGDKQQVKQIPKTGGPQPTALLLPMAALLAVSGVVAYAVLRRR